MDSLVTKKATFCDTGFGKLNLITNAQGKLISMNCETKMDKTGFKELKGCQTEIWQTCPEESRNR
jgi:hypothetical protein